MCIRDRKRKTESLKPIDKAIYRMVSKPSGRNESERRSSLEKSKPQRSSTFPEGEGSMDRRKLTDVAVHSGGVKATEMCIRDSPRAAARLRHQNNSYPEPSRSLLAAAGIPRCRPSKSSSIMARVPGCWPLRCSACLKLQP